MDGLVMAERTRHDALPLRTVARLTGLSPDVIRAWERRYGVVAPARGPRGARLYSNADVAQLQLLRQAVAAGRAIGDVARLSRPDLEHLVSARAAASAVEERPGVAEPPAGEPVSQALAALERFDRAALDRCIGDALVALGTRAFIARVAVPLMQAIGDRWLDGRLSVADEHLVSGLMRNLLAGVLRTRAATGTPTVLLATPAGERHEFGLLLAGLLVAEAGCDLCYLGSDLPAAEVVSAARRAGAAVLGLGITNRAESEAMTAEVRRVERELPPSIELWLGGRGAAAVAAQLGPSRALVVDQMTTLDNELARLRASRAERA